MVAEHEHEQDPELAALWEALVEADAEADDARAAELLAELSARLGPTDPAVLLEQARLRWRVEGAAAARVELEAALARHGSDAELHYLMARACEELGDRPAMVHHDLEVRRLDRLGDGPLPRETLDFIESVAHEVLAALPSRFAEHLVDLPIVLEERPNAALVREGFDPRSLGLFEGPRLSEREGMTPLAPPRIVLFTANLLAEFPEREELASQVEITLLHEIGHFFDLEEVDVERLGLG